MYVVLMVIGEVSKGSDFLVHTLGEHVVVNMLPDAFGPAMAVGFDEPLDVGFVEVEGDPSEWVIGAWGHHISRLSASKNSPNLRRVVVLQAGAASSIPQ
jgi:hypothetical protein